MANVPSINTKQLDMGIEGSLSRLVARGYNEKGNLDAFRDFGDPSVVVTNVATGVTTKQYSNYPKIASTNTTYSPAENNQPVSCSLGPVMKTVIIAAADGVTFDYSTSPLALDPDGSVGFPINVSSLTPTISIVIEGATNADTLTLSNINLTSYGFAVDTWDNLRLNLSQFTATAAFPYANARKVKITASAAMTMLTQQVQTGNNIFCLVGAPTSMMLVCPKELEEDIDRKVEMVMCQNTTKDSRATGYEATLTFKSLGMSLEHAGFSMGTATKAGNQLAARVINGDGGLKNAPIAAGVLTTGITLDPDKIQVVVIDGQVLKRVQSTTQVDDGSYHVTSAGVFTFSTVYNGKTPFIEDKANRFVSYVIDKGIIDSFAFYLTSKRTIEGNLTREVQYLKVKFNSIALSQEDAYADSDVEMSVLTDPKGDYRKIFQY